MRILIDTEQDSEIWPAIKSQVFKTVKFASGCVGLFLLVVAGYYLHEVLLGWLMRTALSHHKNPNEAVVLAWVLTILAFGLPITAFLNTFWDTKQKARWRNY